MHYTARVCVREFLNLPGFHAGAYVLAEVEDTSRRKLKQRDGDWQNHRPNLTLEITDCNRRIELEFDVSCRHELENALYKVDTLIDALWRFRQGLRTEAALFAERQAEIGRRESAGTEETAGRRDVSRVA